ncbi:MAG: hypothetical protein ACJ0RQ_13190 [Candidatus Azotimanducaceae bacterium]
MVTQEDVITPEERRYLRRRNEDLRVLYGDARKRSTTLIRRIGYGLIGLYLLRGLSILLVHQFALTDEVPLHYPVDTLTVLSRIGFLAAFTFAYFYFIDQPRIISAISVAALSVTGLLIWLDIEWWYLTLVSLEPLFWLPFILRLLCFIGLIAVHVLLRHRDG